MILPLGIGLVKVLFIIESISESHHIFNAPDAPAPKAMHTIDPKAINGFRGIKRGSFNNLNLDALGYTIEYQATIRALKKGMKIVEIPTVEGPRIGGESYAKSIPTGIKFLKCLIRELVISNPK